jgi:hypothetical protein
MVLDESTADHCRRCIVEEERLGNEAPTLEAGERHFQLAMLYRAQLAVVERQVATSPQPGLQANPVPDRTLQSVGLGH